jgi:hypothetical protein
MLDVQGTIEYAEQGSRHGFLMNCLGISLEVLQAWKLASG